MSIIKPLVKSFIKSNRRAYVENLIGRNITKGHPKRKLIAGQLKDMKSKLGRRNAMSISVSHSEGARLRARNKRESN